MASAIVVILASSVMMVGGRRLMRFEQHSAAEGLLSCFVGIGLSLAWYHAFPNDFADLADYIGWTLRSMSWSQSLVSSFALAALFPASIAVVCIFVMARWEQRRTKGVATFFGPLGRVRRPKLLR
jgi:Na+/phosphate symporter